MAMMAREAHTKAAAETHQSAADFVLAEVRSCFSFHGLRSCLVAFSGGPDSLALAWACAELSARSSLRVVVAHFDHGLDEEASSRAQSARRLAAQLSLPFELEQAPSRPAGTSLEGWAREERYNYLAQVAERHGLESIATAHHADDQAETVLLRLLYGSGIEGLAGIKPRYRSTVRPLLGVRRHHILETVAELGLEPITDPTNRDSDRPRNRIRHFILPEWNLEEPELVADLGRLAIAAKQATQRLDRRLRGLLDISSLPGIGATLSLPAFADLAPELHSHGLSALDRAANRHLPTASTARQELIRQIAAGRRIGCDAGDGWRWQADSRHLRLLEPQKPMPRFTYTVNVPGAVTVTELGTRLRIAPAPSGRPANEERSDRFFVRLPSDDRCRIEIRNRRPGDRLRPVGRIHEKRLKEVLIDRRIPRDMRDRLPLLVVNDHIAWVPGVTFDERFVARPDEPAWLVELRPVTGSPPSRDSNDERGSTP